MSDKPLLTGSAGSVSGDSAAAFQRIVEFAPAYDKRDPDPKKSYGIHGVELRMLLKGPEGVVQFLVFTNWHLPNVTEENLQRCARSGDALTLKCLLQPLPADVGYHSPKPMYEGHEPMDSPCQYLDGPCYYDGSSLAAKDMYETLLQEGSEGVWRALESVYNREFRREKAEVRP